MSEYEKQASDLLESFGVKFEVRHVGSACPPFCPDRDDMTEAGKFPRRKHIHGDQHLCTLSRPGKIATFDFWNSYRDQEIAYHLKERHSGWAASPWGRGNKHDPWGEGRAMINFAKTFSPLPTAYSLLAYLQKYDPGTFKDFCADFGYSDDSIKALGAYQAVQDEFEKVRRFFTASELEQIQEIS